MPSSVARKLRSRPTDAERKLWSLLRGKRLGGFNFRRQVPLGKYVVDFACLAERLILEVDGGRHASSQQRDEARTVWLAAQNFRVLRFWNNDVLANPEGVCARIPEALQEESPHPNPPPQGGRK